MATSATSLKLPAPLKRRIDRLARKAAETPHALMIRALEAQIDAMERHEAFKREAKRADNAMEQSGLGFEADAVHRYLRSRIKGRKAKRPRPIAWRD